MTDTIFACATAPGQAGVAVVRVSGPQTGDSLAALCGHNIQKFKGRRARLVSLTDPVTRETIDQALALYFKAPASFTGEDVAEYHIHGSPAVLAHLLECLGTFTHHRLAEPGEFTRRAFENGKMDLTSAEGLADLIAAETRAQKAQALSQMGGALYSLYEEWAGTLKKALAHLEADIEFPDEDLPQGIMPQILPQIEHIQNAIAVHLADNNRGERLRNGLQVAVIGAPNAGKSTLVNALARRDVAIVSATQGTTRDIIEVPLDLAGLPVTLCDTAGLRPEAIRPDAQDQIESEGIRRARERARQADIRILVFDAQSPADEDTLALADENALVVISKAELQPLNHHLPAEALQVSVHENTGLDVLIEALTGKARDLIGASETPALTRQRHRDALQQCLNALERSQNAGLPELAAEDLRLAVREIGRITGRVDVEDLLDVVFRDFCIGK